MSLVMKIRARFCFAGLLMLIMLFNSACGKKNDLTLPEEPINNEEQTQSP